MKKPSTEELVVPHFFLKADRGNDRTDRLHKLLNRETKLESEIFYGPDFPFVAKYAGKDYNNPAHRLRLAQFPGHQKLFEVMDELRLTDQEIQDFCVWDGTRSAKETHELRTEVRIEDTTWSCIPDWRFRPASCVPDCSFKSTSCVDAMEASPGNTSCNALSDAHASEQLEDSGDESLAQSWPLESSDEVQSSVGEDLNGSLAMAEEARSRGDEVVLDADCEQSYMERARLREHPQLPDPISLI